MEELNEIAMRKAIEESKNNLKNNYKKGGPFGAVIVKNGKIISSAHNTVIEKHDATAHAEVNAIQAAGNKLEDWRLDGYSMIVTLEPCEMCSCIIKESRLDKVYYFLPKKYNDLEYNFNINKDQILGYGEDKEYFLELLTSFFDNKR